MKEKLWPDIIERKKFEQKRLWGTHKQIEMSWKLKRQYDYENAFIEISFEKRKNAWKDQDLRLQQLKVATQLHCCLVYASFSRSSFFFLFPNDLLFTFMISYVINFCFRMRLTNINVLYECPTFSWHSLQNRMFTWTS